MSWKKHFSPVATNSDSSPLTNKSSGSNPGPARTNYSSYLPDIYTGSPNRVERYSQYEVMDSDPEVNAALDILAEFCTQKLKDGKSPFNIKWRHKATNTEVRILSEYMQQWTKLQQFDTRIFRIVRNIFKYGDGFFIRDPETQKWSWVDPTKIVKILVNESDGKRPAQYVIKDLAPNFMNLIATQITPNVNPRQNSGGVIPSGGYSGATATQRGTSGPSPTSSSGSRWGLAETENAVSAEHVVHLSLSEGLDNNYPFGNSLLENIFKVYKQKELLEDAILIYRIQRAPERRVFHIDVGNMPSHLAMAFVERVKNEIHQRRIPSQTGGSQNVIDSAYNPMCLDLSTMIPLLDGRTLQLSEIISEFEQGKENWVYSCDPITGEVMPGVVDWAGVTRKNTETIKITLDNDQVLICTPDHKIPVLGKGFVEAKDLTPDDSLIAFNTQAKRISGGKTNEYQQVWDHKTKTWLWTHRMVGEFFRKRESTYLPKLIQHDGAYLNEQIELTEEVHGCKIKTIEVVSNRDVGTLTVDGNEKWHSHHTFAIASGIFVKNSMSEDYFFPKTCCSLTTKVKLLNDKSLTIQELIEDYENGIENFTYTVNQKTHEIEVGKIVWAGVTRKNAQVVEVILDSGESVTVTPDHRFIMRDGSEVEAQHLTEGDSLMPLHNAATANNHKVQSVTWLTDTEDTGDITIESASGHHNFSLDIGVFIHNSEGRGSDVTTLPGGCFAMDTKVSLLDGRELSIADIEIEMQAGKELWTYSCEPKTGKIVPGLISWAGVTHKSAKVMKLTLDNGADIICTPCHKFPIYGSEFKRAGDFTIGESLIPLYRKSESKLGKNQNDYEQVFDNASNTWVYTHRVVADFLKDTVVNYEMHDGNVGNWSINDGFTGLWSLVKQFCYAGWKDFRIKESIHAHRVINIEYLDDEIEVGTLTIDSNEVFHDYHTFALTAGVMCKNSNLGEIDDLKYFTNKLFRGLRIPSSYLPTGADDSQASFNDGRVGTAYIQELRFNKYCERLQSLLTSTFDDEFKMYIYSRGLNIDINLFELEFNPPMNFASSRQISLDSERISTFNTIQSVAYISKRFALKRFLGLTDEEIAENERSWGEEQGKGEPTHTDAAGELRSAGLSAAGIAGDFGAAGDMSIPDDLGIEGEAPVEQGAPLAPPTMPPAG